VPRIVNPRNRYSFSRGEDHYLVCEVRIPAYAKAYSRFLPKVTWKEPDYLTDFKRNKKPVTYESIRQLMVRSNDSYYEEAEYAFFYRLTDFESYDAGVYVCEAQNEAGFTKREFTVTVDGNDILKSM